MCGHKINQLQCILITDNLKGDKNISFANSIHQIVMLQQNKIKEKEMIRNIQRRENMTQNNTLDLTSEVSTTNKLNSDIKSKVSTTNNLILDFTSEVYR